MHYGTLAVCAFAIFGFLLFNILVRSDLTKAADSTWTQTDWSGGSGEGHANTSTEYLSGTNVDPSTAGQVMLEKSEEKLANAGFETDSADWSVGGTPDSISGMQLWLKADAITGLADGAAVTTWNDLSGNTQGATQASATLKPLYKTGIVNNQPVVRFDGSDDEMTITGTVAHGTVFLVGKRSNTSQPFAEVSGGNSLNRRGLIGLYHPTYSTYDQYFVNGVGVANGGGGSINAFNLFTGKSPSTLANTTNFRLGFGTPSYLKLNGDIAELIIYNTSLSEADRKKIEAYLQKKYAVNSGYLTVTPDAEIKHSGNSSLKLAAGANGGDLVQSVNLGDTANYNLSAYAYIDGVTAVDNTFAELVYDGVVVPNVNYADIGDGWYKLSGVVTGADAVKSFGVQVKANKTVYLDDFSLKNYKNPAIITSNIFDTTQSSNWGNLEFAATGTASIKVRTSNASDPTMSEAKDFSDASCVAIASTGTDIPNNECSTDTDRYIQYEITLSTVDTSQTPVVQSISVNYSPSDQGDPDNPSALTTMSSQKNGGNNIITNTWYNHTSSYFSWDEPNDPPDENEISSGIAGYYVYFGTGASSDPGSQRGIAIDTGGGKHYQTDTDFEIGVDTSVLVTGQTYYLRIETEDAAGNIKHLNPADPSLFIYKYDGTPPSNPALFSFAPNSATWYSNKDLIFSWYISGGNAASDAGGSAIAGFQYRLNSGTWYGTGHTGTQDGSDLLALGLGTYTLIDAEAPSFSDDVVKGENVFELRTWDNAGNYSNMIESGRTLKASFKYNDTVPYVVSSLNADPAYSTVNSFGFNWTPPNPPDEYTGDPADYVDHYEYYVDNESTGWDSIDALSVDGIQALRNGVDTDFCIRAIDNAQNTGNKLCVTFKVNSPPPSSPSDVEMVDVSSRDRNLYKISINWNEPAQKGAGFDGYDIYRSADGEEFSTPIATNRGQNASTSFTDSGLDNTTRYYYRISAVDNTGQESESTLAVDQESRLTYLIPTGRYTSPPNFIEESLIVQPKAFSALITWKTEDSNDAKHMAKGSVLYGTDPKNLGGDKAGQVPTEKNYSNEHSILLTGLEPSVQYFYEVVWDDVDNQEGKKEGLTFVTKDRPAIDLPKADNISLNSATISWQSKTILNATVTYCTEIGNICGTIKDYSGIENENHVVQLSDLVDGTKYLYQISGTDIDGNNVVSSKAEFSTRTRPKISDLRFETIDAPTTSLKFSWQTNIPTTSIVSYQGGGTSSSKAEADLKMNHEIIISGLSDRTTYSLQSKGVDEFGNQCLSDLSTFTTPNDTRPPKLRNLAVEIKSTGFGSAQKAQIIVTWETDELSTSQVEYGQGIEGTEYSFRSKEDGALTTSHAVIVSELEPSKIYHLRAVSRDNSGNPGYSEDTTTITGKSQSSVIDIIMNSLSRSLGWMFNIFN